MMAVAAWGMLASCDRELLAYEQGDVQVFVEAGDAWLHDFPLFLGLLFEVCKIRAFLRTA